VASADDRQAEPAQPQPPVLDEPAVAEQFQARIEELTQERDRARQESFWVQDARLGGPAQTKETRP
jgi:hypothetical protein